MHLCSFIIYLHLGMIVACSCLARIQWLLRSHHPPGHSTASSDTKCMHEEFHSWMCWVMLCIFDWFWVSCSIVFVPLYCAAFVKWAQAKPPHTVVCWCLSDPGLYRLVKWVKCMWKILKDCTWRNLYSMIILYANVSNLWFGLDSWIQFGKAAVAGIACLGVLIGLCIVRDVPRLGEQKWNAERCISCSSCCVYLFENQTRTPSISKYLQVLRTCKLFDSWARLRLPRSTGIDSARGLSCGLLFLVGQAMETWKHGKTWNDGKTCVFFQLWLPSGGHCWVLGWSDQSGQLSLRQSQENGWESLKSWAVWTQRCTSQTYQTQNSSKLGVPTGFSKIPQEKGYGFTGLRVSRWALNAAGLEEILAIFGHWRCLYCYCCPVLGSQVRSNLMPGLQF